MKKRPAAIPRFPVDREKLIQRLDQVQPGLSTREIIQQASCYIFIKGRVLTFNEEVACSIKSGMPKEFTGAVPAKPLLEILRRLPINDLQVEVTKNEIVITAKRKRIKLTRDPFIVLPVETVETPEKEWKKLSEHFLPGIDLVQESAGKDQSTIWVNVHITPDFVEACNNDEMSRYKCKTPVDGSILVRQSAIKALPGLELSQIQETDAWLHFRNEQGLIVSLRKYSDTYPKLSPFFKIEGKPIQLPKTLIESLDCASIFSSENADNNVVSISLREGELKVLGKGMHGSYMEPKKVRYSGEPFCFMIQPKLMAEIVKNHSECQLAEGHKLKVLSGRFRYVASLLEPDALEKSIAEKIEADSGESGDF